MSILSKRKFRLSAIILLIGTILTMGYAVYAFTPDALPFPEGSDEHFVSYQANAISKPLQYWVLTEPDATILEAIAKSSTPEHVDPITGEGCEHWTEVRANETTFIYQVFFEQGQIWEIEYEGNHYCVDCLYHIDPVSHTNPNRIGLPISYYIHNARHEKELAMVLTPVFSGAWIALGFLWIRKKPEPQ